jgi:TRAP-type C4-dicarboxylate transport system substrate-binding protein
VQITVHPGGALGIKGPESLRAVRDGIVPIADMALLQQVGDEPIFGFDALPYFADGFDQLAIAHGLVWAEYEKVLAKHNQKLLYAVPWPNIYIFTKKPVKTLADLKGAKMRTFDKNSTDLMARLGMVPVQLAIGDVLPALSSGALDATSTSAGTAAAQKYWEFTKFAYQTNHAWTTNGLTVNLDQWKKLSPQHQAAIEKLAKELQPQFWEIAKAEDAKASAVLRQNGMSVEMADAAMVKDMRAAALPMWDEFATRVGGSIPAALKEYRAKTGK